MIIALLIGLFFGLLTAYLLFKVRVGSFEKLGNEILHKAEIEAAESKVALKEESLKQERLFKAESEQHEKKWAEEKKRLEKREEKIDGQLSQIESKLSELSQREEKVRAREEEANTQLESLAGLTAQEAKEQLFDQVKAEVHNEAAKSALRIKKEAEENAEREAARIIATAIGRMAVPTVSEAAVTILSLPNEEMKGRIIGREGRNIRALEELTGVNFVIDEGIVISGLDPIRKEIAKQAVKELIKDGRIHPTRIEEVVRKSEERFADQIKEIGEDAALRAGILNLDPELIELLGKLNFRTSFGQNVLEHSLEVSSLMGMMAAELHLDVDRAKRIGLLHDIGKAVSHEVEGTHAMIGHDTALRCGETEEVANGIGCHHEEMEPKTVEASLCSSADKISGGRPGARIEALEQYIKRARKLETISSQFEGVEKAYALQAGKEVRVIVEPSRLDDISTLNLAREIAKKIEKELSYPGKIKVTVIREKRAIEYAT